MTWSFGWCQNEKCESFQLQGVYHCLCTCQNWRHQNYLFLEESREFRMVLGPQFHLNTLVENRPESRHYRHRHRHRHTHTYSYIPFHYVQLHAIAYSYSYICTHLHTHTRTYHTHITYIGKNMHVYHIHTWPSLTAKLWRTTSVPERNSLGPTSSDSAGHGRLVQKLQPPAFGVLENIWILKNEDFETNGNFGA